MSFEPLAFLLERLWDISKHESTILLEDEQKEIQSLQTELDLIEPYLKAMDEVQRQATLNPVLQKNVQLLMDIIPEIEDFLDQLIYQNEQQSEAHKKRRLENVKAFFSLTSNPIIRKHSQANRITEIKEKIRNALQRLEEYQLPNNFPQVTHRTRHPTNSAIIKDEIIIGLDDDVDTLVAKFLGRDGKCGANSAIVGMGGSGKTTLAKMFYNHKEIKEAFPRRCAWVCVSQKWNALDLLLQICELLRLELSENQKKFPRVKLQEFLEEGACLVVLDDVWEQNALHELLPTLLSGNGRVMITTRKEKIIKFPRIPDFYLHRARRLTPEQSWELFSRIVGNYCEGIINFEEDGDYVKLGKERLQKCDGLPLAIVTLAGLLRTKRSIHQWSNIKDRVISIIMEDGNDPHDNEAVGKVLELSYFDLPYDLKPCFLYLGIFKEDEVIEVDRLIHWWICEGFVKVDQRHRSKRLEEEAMNHLEELVQRCMVQATDRDYEGNLLKVRIHDLIRDLCMNKAEEFGFLKVLFPSTTSTQIKLRNYRAIIYERKSFILDNPRLRTLMYFVNIISRPPKESFPFETLKLLRVLSLDRVVLGESAKHIGNMVLLRSLELTYCDYNIENVYFIKKLRNLETLIMSGGNISELLPDNMVGIMERLRVLELDVEEGDLSAAISGVANLSNLQKLTQSPLCQGLAKELRDSRNNYLRVLKLYCMSSQPYVDDICECVGNNLPLLETLELYLDLRQSELGFDPQKMKWGRCQALKELELRGKIINQSESWLCPPKLLSLILRFTKIEKEEDMVKFIARLDHLWHLNLSSKSYLGEKLTIVGFPQLQMLCLDELVYLKECEITPGSLPKLIQLCIEGCGKLQRIPDGISKIHTLQVLNVSGHCTRTKTNQKEEHQKAT